MFVIVGNACEFISIQDNSIPKGFTSRYGTRISSWHRTGGRRVRIRVWKISYTAVIVRCAIVIRLSLSGKRFSESLASMNKFGLRDCSVNKMFQHLRTFLFPSPFPPPSPPFSPRRQNGGVPYFCGRSHEISRLLLIVVCR